MKQKYQFIDVSESGGCATLALNRPPLNVLNIEMMDEVNSALAELRNNTSARVLLIRGEGKCFSAGMNVEDHLPGKVDLMMKSMHTMFVLLSEIEIPTVCAVHGSAMGGGLELAAFADMTFAEQGTKFGLPEIKLGVFPPIAVACFLEIIGPKKTFEIVLTGRTISSEQAVNIGIINDVYPASEFQNRVAEIVKMLAELSRPVLIATKKALRGAPGKPVFAALEEAESIYMDEVMKTEDAIEGLTSFLEKRAPQWNHC